MTRLQMKLIYENRMKCERLGRELWRDLYKKVSRKEVDVVLHLGNIPISTGTAVASGAETRHEQLHVRKSSDPTTSYSLCFGSFNI